jgi:hypothetical protein
VFVVNNAGHNFSAAEKWGRLVPILEGNINVFRPDRTIFNILQVLKKYKFSQNDFVLLSGNSLGNVLATACICAGLNVYKFNILLYNARDEEYIPFEFDVSNLRLRRKK